MAHKRKAKTRTRTVYKKAKARRSKSSGGKVEAIQPHSMVYGAIRSPVSRWVEPYTARLGSLGGLSDELAMGVGSYFLAKKGKGFFKKVGLSGLTVENARVGEAFGGSLLSPIGGGSQTSSDGYFYG